MCAFPFEFQIHDFVMQYFKLTHSSTLVQFVSFRSHLFKPDINSLSSSCTLNDLNGKAISIISDVAVKKASTLLFMQYH